MEKLKLSALKATWGKRVEEWNAKKEGLLAEMSPEKGLSTNHELQIEWKKLHSMQSALERLLAEWEGLPNSVEAAEGALAQLVANVATLEVQHSSSMTREGEHQVARNRELAMVLPMWELAVALGAEGPMTECAANIVCRLNWDLML